MGSPSSRPPRGNSPGGKPGPYGVYSEGSGTEDEQSNIWSLGAIEKSATLLSRQPKVDATVHRTGRSEQEGVSKIEVELQLLPVQWGNVLAVSKRRGVAKIRHLHTPLLWLQTRVGDGEPTMSVTLPQKQSTRKLCSSIWRRADSRDSKASRATKSSGLVSEPQSFRRKSE
eukprot:3276949-Amphidinium_carterae.1